MVAVGDSNEVYMFNITNSGEYVHTASLCGKSKTNMLIALFLYRTMAFY